MHKSGTDNKYQSIDEKVFVEQIKLVYESFLPVVAANIIVSTLLAYILLGVVSQKILLIWLCIIYLVSFGRVILYILFRQNFTFSNARIYARYYLAGSAIAGLAWGIGAIVMFPEQGLEYQALILFIVVILGASSVTSYSIYMPVFYSFTPVDIIPLAVYMLFSGDRTLTSLGLMSLVGFASLLYFARNANRSHIESLRLRFENIDLVEQLREQKEEAENANLSKSRFLAAASHDLRQPVHALSLFASVLYESVKSDKNRKIVRQIETSIDILSNLFNTLLDLSRLESGMMQINKIDFSLQSVIKRFKNEFDIQARDKAISIAWPEEDVWLRSDPDLLESILRNFISNAIRYTDKGGVTLRLRSDGDHVCIETVDTGTGIPLEEQETIFDEFHQLGNPERDSTKGLGLGLAIVKRTAFFLGHPVAVVSAPGAGSNFGISVNKGVKGHNDIPIELSDPVEMLPDVPLVIVNIDDDQVIREGTKRLLETWGCTVISAADENDALVQLAGQSQAPDGIIADYRLPERKTGVDAIHAIRHSCNQDVPALIVTGDIAVEGITAVKDSGIQVLNKPVAAIKLRTFLRYVQRKRGGVRHYRQ